MAHIELTKLQIERRIGLLLASLKKLLSEFESLEKYELCGEAKKTIDWLSSLDATNRPDLDESMFTFCMAEGIVLETLDDTDKKTVTIKLLNVNFPFACEWDEFYDARNLYYEQQLENNQETID